MTVGALEALGVPVSVQHLQDELVQDVLTTAGTLRDLCGAKKKQKKQEATSGSNELFREIDSQTTTTTTTIIKKKKSS